MQHPVDEFADVTAQIARLNMRRDALREMFLKPDRPLRSNRYEVVVRHQTRRVLDKSLLPSAILNDPKYFKVSTSPVVTVRALQGRRIENDDDFDLIEPA